MEEHLPKLIIDLGLILCVGAVTTLIFKRINQPLVLGYIIAGFLVGPHFEYIPTVAEEHNVEIWAKIGVIFLLFSLGLEFSFKKLLNVGGSASVTAIVEIVCIVTVGYFVGRLMNWSTMDSIFLGGLLASSSTTIIIRAFEELGLKRKKFANVVFGILIVEDIVVILLMVMLSTMAVSQHFDGSDLINSFVKLGFFLAIWFIGGIFIIPTFLRSIKNYLDDETLLIISIGLCLGMVYIADRSGFSIELGAFVMGSILAETIYAEKIELNFQSVKNLFATIFFISIGMMIDPVSMYEHKWSILIVTLLTIFGKLIFTTLGAILSGQPLKQSVQLGMSMAQIGEFAFIVAGLGLSLGVTSDFLFPVAVGVSAITTFTTPYLIKSSDKVYLILEKILPQKFIIGIEKYSTDTQHIQNENKWNKIIKQTFSTIFINGIIIIAITLIIKSYFLLFLMDWFTYFGASLVSLILTFVLCIPFIWAIIGYRPKREIIREFWDESNYNRAPIIAIIFIRLVLVIVAVIFIYNQFLTSTLASIILAIGLLIMMYFLSKFFNQFYNYIQTKFIYNLNEREILSKRIQEKKKKEKFQYTWDNTHISDMIVPQNANFVGVRLGELDWRTKFQINIAYIKRGDRIIQTPNSESVLYPFDKIGIIGTDEYIQRFEKYLDIIGETPSENNDLKNTDNFTLDKVVIPSDFCALEHKTIGWVKDTAKGIVVSIERNGKMIHNPDRNVAIELGDYLTIVADKKNLKKFIQTYHLK
ncbi:cation:proton antiporter [Empedobacter sp. 225-1]|uniref:cation:proton antiporter domain-containing protein n=1 Tax=unclassified Empedobacter TaxID=2643773 RepID=UPI0025790F7F|nr:MULTISPECIES: cation:proton antiporter [unclassified Empedobacter]MDM1522785.1 cation:proton antiporter [Empedobacter sp. 225-1]MDM1542845.1 cation:proton antiporter [Empedobacter sp. 189-2]